MALAAPLVSQGEHDPGPAACLGDRAPFGDGIGNRLVEKHVLGRRGGGARGFQMRVVRRGVDDRLDCAIFQDRLVARRRLAAVFGGEGPAFLFGARVAGDDFEFFGPLGGVGENVRPPAHPDAGDPKRLERHRPTSGLRLR